MPRIYRSMKEDNGWPAVADTASGLGVRVGVDVHPDAGGQVGPGGGGMSVRPGLWAYPPHLVPRRLRPLLPGALGSNSLRVWRLGEGAFASVAVNEKLALRVDAPNHGVVEPRQVVHGNEFRQALLATRERWTIDESPS